MSELCAPFGFQPAQHAFPLYQLKVALTVSHEHVTVLGLIVVRRTRGTRFELSFKIRRRKSKLLAQSRSLNGKSKKKKNEKSLALTYGHSYAKAGDRDFEKKKKHSGIEILR